MENRQFVSRILELQNSAAKSSTLESQNEEYVKRTNDMEQEIKKLRSSLKQVEAVKNTFERDMAVYVAENKNLKQQITLLKSAHDNNTTTSARLLHEIRDGNKKLMDLKEEEFQSTLSRIKEEKTASEKEWREKIKNIEAKNISLRTENKNLESQLKEMSTKITETEKLKSSTTIKSKIQIQALETKILNAEEENRRILEKHEKERSKLMQECKDKDKHSSAQLCISRKVQEDMKRQLDSGKIEIEKEKSKNDELNENIKRLELQLKCSQASARKLEDDNIMKLKLSEEKILSLEQEIILKNKKANKLQKQLLDAQEMSSKDTEELTEKLATMKREKKATQDRIAELVEEVRESERTKSKIEASKKALKERNETVVQELEKMTRNFKSMEGKCIGLQNELDSQINKVSSIPEMKREILELKSEKRELENDLDQLEQQLKCSQESARNVEDDNIMKLKLSEEKVSSLEEEIILKNKKMNKLQKQLLDAQEMSSKDTEELTEKLATMKREKKIAQDRIAELMEEVSESQRMKTKIEASKKALKEKNESVVQELEKMTRNFKSMEDKYVGLQKELNSQSNKVSSIPEMKREILQLKTEKKALENDLDEKERDFVKISSNQRRMSDVEKSAKETETRLRNELESMDREMKNMERKYEKKIDELENKLQKQLTDTREKNDKYTDELTEKLATVKREKREAEDRISELRDEINQSEKLKIKIETNSRVLKEKHEEVVQQFERMTRNFSCMEEKCASLEKELDSQSNKCSSIPEMRREILQLKSEKRTLENDLEEKEEKLIKITSNQKRLSTVEKSAKETEDRLKNELESAEIEMENIERKYKNQIGELQNVLSDTQRKLAAKNISSVTMCKKVEEDYQKQLDEKRKMEEVNTKKLEQERGNIEKLKQELESALNEIESVKDEKATLEEKFYVLRENCTVIETMEEQLDDYHDKCKELQEQNASLIEKLAVATREKGGANRKVEKYENENKENEEKMEEMEKALETLKQTCVMLEEQIVGLEKFNNQLVKNQEELSEEKEKAVKESRNVKKKLGELEHTVALEKRRGVELKDNVDEQMIELQVQAREEANKVQELEDELSDLDRKYKLLEMNANSLQQKLNGEKDLSERFRQEAENSRSRMATLESVRQQTSSGLRSEIERSDALAHEKTALQNELDTMKMKQSHESIKMNCTLGQQSKLIDFLQAKVESLEPQDKKKKKKKNDLYQVPLQYRELQDMLEESKQTNIQLQQKVNDLRTELQNTKSDVHRLKHGITGATPSTSTHALSPGSMAAISALLKSPNAMNTPQSGNTRSKPRMHHNIPHRLIENLCIHTTKCLVCLDTVRFGRASLRCTECHASCHIKCRSNMTSTCGLPGGLVQHYKQGGGKTHAASPVSCITNGTDVDGNAQGWLKVFCGGTSWERKFIQLRDGVVIISNTEKPVSTSKKLKVDINNKEREIIDLVQQQGYVHSTVPVSELEGSAKADIPYVFKLELGPDTSCWPPRNLYFLSSGFTDKQKWVAALESITTRNTITQNMINDSKIIGNKILTMQVNEKLEINCSLPISKEKVLFACDEGLYILSPSTTVVSDRSSMTKVTGAQQILQMNFLKSPSLIVAIEGTKRRIVTFDVNNLITSTSRPNDISVKLVPVDDLSDCHIFAVGSVEGAPHLCSATASTIQIHRYNAQLKKFVKRKEISTSEPCTCLQFTMCSIIMGTNKFYEIELKSYKVDEFLDSADRSLMFDYDSFPVSVLQIGEKNGKYEYLLCYHEFGVFVDCFGKRTRKDNMLWSRLPLSFAYKSPYLIVTHFHSVEIIRITSYQSYNDSLTTDQSYINIASPRYLGPAITEGAVYLSANEGGKITVFCCKGNMDNSRGNASKENKNVEMAQKSCLKRRRMQLTASSQESLDVEEQARSKRLQRSPSIGSATTILSDSTNMSVSCESLLSCNTSKWTLGSKMTNFPGDTPKSSVPRRCRNLSYDSIDSAGTVTSTDGTYRTYSEDDASSIHSSSSNNSNNSNKSNANRLMMWKPVTPGSGKRLPPEKPVRKSKTPNKLNFDPVDV